MRKDTVRTLGLDLGDRWSHVCELDAGGGVVDRARVRTTPAAFRKWFVAGPRGQVALEAGTHSLWSARLLEELGFEVIVANPRQVALITRSDRKTDKADAELLARLARMDPRLLSPVTPRTAQDQADRGMITARDAVVRTRTLLINHVRGTCKAFGHRLSACAASSFGSKVAPALPDPLRPALLPLLEQISSLTQTIRAYDRQVEALCEKHAPTAHLRQIRGVGPITALAFVLAIGDPRRFSRSRKVGAYVGLCPRQDQSGARDPQLRITKAGDPLLRRLLLQCAHYMLGPFGEDSDLRRWAERKSKHGGRAARKRALVAVARRLAVRLHRIWMTGETYDALRLARARGEVAA